MRKNMSIFILFLLAIAALLSGCNTRSKSPQPAAKVVDSIQILFENGENRLTRQYTAPTKMRAILNYLRWIDPYGTPKENPDAIHDNTFRIVMYFTDGSEKTYVQKADRYMQVDGKAWQFIDAENARTLSQMVAKMESDI